MAVLSYLRTRDERERKPDMTQQVTAPADDGPRNRGAESRDAILLAASQLFARHGYRGTSLASIAEAAGLSQPGLLHHFPSKKALLLAVLAERDSADGPLASPPVQGKGIGIIDGIGTLVAHNETAPDPVRMFSVLLGEATAPDHPAREYFVDRYERIRSRFIRHLSAAQAQGQLDAGADVGALANVLIAVMDGLQFQWLLDDSVDMTAGYALLASLIRDTLMI
jgi:AcrR family transcriptional regulator